MIAELIDRRSLKAEVREQLAGAQVSPRLMTALYMGLTLALSFVSSFTKTDLFSIFIDILTTLLAAVLSSGFTLYCMAIRRGERSEFLTLFDGFSFAGKIIALNLVIYLFVCLWSMLFVLPGLVASYRYRFALFNLYENPELSVFEALNMSKRQTFGYKGQLLLLDLSYLGWGMLASIPSVFYNSEAYLMTAQSVMNQAGAGTLSAFPPETFLFSTLPIWTWTLISGLWQLLISLFYTPAYHCVELGYFEVAKRTSGVGHEATPPHDSWHNGPDDMGDF